MIDDNQVAVTIIAMRCRKCGITEHTPDFFTGQEFWRQHNLHGPILFIRAISEELDVGTSAENFHRQMEALYRRLG
jgi:hypothetical protein